VSVIRIACIVEGKGDTQSVPAVVMRVAQREAPLCTVIAESYVRRDRKLLVQRVHLEADIEFAARKLGGQGGILIVFDADDDCPAQLGPEMQDWAMAARSDLPVAVVLANREFEAWFLAAIDSLGGRCGLPDSLTAPSDPESIRGAKERITRQMRGSRTYRATVDQVVMARHFDLDLARQRSDSFDKCYREITRLLRALTS
jgi:hypothetical protein